MVQQVDPLGYQVPIVVKEVGSPTPYFLRQWQNLLSIVSTLQQAVADIASITTLANGKIYIGNASNVATEVTPSGDVTIDNTGVTTIGVDKVTYAKMQNVSATQRVIGRNTSGAGDPEEVTASQVLDWVGSTRGSVLYRGASGWAALTPGTSGHVLTSAGAGADPAYAAASGGLSATLTSAHIYVGNGSNVATDVAVTGDVTINNAGVTAIGAGKVTEAMQVLADNTTQDVSTTKHGYAPKAPNSASKYLDGTGAWTSPSGSVGAAPTIVQTATDRSTTTGDTTLSPTFGANTTVGNYLVFLVTGFSNLAGSGAISVSTPAITSFFFRDRGSTTANQGVWVFVWKVASAATAYTVTVGSPNGGESVLVLELDNLNKVEARAYQPTISGATIQTSLTIQKGALNILISENDNDTGAIVSQTSGLTTLYSGHGTVNHAGYFFNIGDTLQGANITITYTSNPTAGNSVLGQIILAA